MALADRVQEQVEELAGAGADQMTLQLLPRRTPFYLTTQQPQQQQEEG